MRLKRCSMPNSLKPHRTLKAKHYLEEKLEIAREKAARKIIIEQPAISLWQRIRKFLFH